ncbi:hypothetical protein [Dyella japonica]|uniref:Uncharacterized protein n=1 Tax=Dyella japonica TaxID=231455 RepID=A0ABV2JN94_9GAMM
MIIVQFSDLSKETIITFFAGQQESAVYPNLGEVDASDCRWIAFFNELPEGTQALLPAPTPSS